MWALLVSDFWFYMHADCRDPDNSQKKTNPPLLIAVVKPKTA